MPAQQSAFTPPATGVEADALETLLGVLRAYARYAPSTAERPVERTQETVARWVRHAAMGQPLDGVGPAAERRQWRELVLAFAAHRRDEGESVQRSLDQLRDAVWSFVGSMHQVARADSEADVSLARCAEQLADSLRRGTESDIREAAESAVGTLHVVLADRSARHRRQVAELGERLAALAEELDEVRRASAIDPLTGLANRKEFDEYLRRLVELHGFVPAPACLLMIDLDDLKTLNDSHGHQAGDEALRLVAGCMSRVFIRKCDFVGRYGGDEYAVVLRETPAASAMARAEQLRREVASIRLPGTARAVTLTLSIGVAELVPGETLDEWMKRADRALYRAKEAGRDQATLAPDLFS